MISPNHFLLEWALGGKRPPPPPPLFNRNSSGYYGGPSLRCRDGGDGVRGLGFRASGLGFRVSGLGMLKFQGDGVAVPGFRAFRVSGFRVSGFVLQTLFRV